MNEGNFTRIPNDVLEALARIRIPGEARQVLDTIFRQTYGWNREWDAISLPQFEARTGLGRKGVCRGIAALRKRNVIRVKKYRDSRRKKVAGRRPVAKKTLLITQYAINKEVTQWKSIKRGVAKMTLPPVSKMTPTKEQRLKEKDRDKDKDVSTPHTPAKKRLKCEGKADVSDRVRVEEMRKNPDKGWNRLILLYQDRFGYLPMWTKGLGSKKEFKNLNGVLKKFNGNMALLLKCFEQYLADEDSFVSKLGHRPSLILGRLDGYLRRMSDEQSGRKKYYVPEGFRI